VKKVNTMGKGPDICVTDTTYEYRVFAIRERYPIHLTCYPADVLPTSIGLFIIVLLKVISS
jgi:hypothetical protein